VAIEKINIEKFLELSENYLVIDVRSPSEYNHAHLPGAKNIPLFSDEERKTVGTTYKQISREEAIKIGVDFFAPKMKMMIEEVERIIGNRQLAISNAAETKEGNNPLNAPDCTLPIANCILIYCWRGGMRSAGVAWLLDLYGYKVYTLAGGYKRFRNYVLDIFKLPFQFRILGGYTGSGKTELLNSLEKSGESVIDLESIACHKGSAFGNLGLAKQPSQEMFENILALQLRSKLKPNEAPIDLLSTDLQTIEQRGKAQSNARCISTPIWLEDESQRIGDINIPHDLWLTMRRSPVYFLEIPFEERLKYIVSAYGKFEREKLLSCITRIEKRLGGLEAKKAIAYLEEDNFIECFRILLKYYDKWYFKSLHNRESLNTLLTIIPYERIEPETSELVLRQIQYQSKTVSV
jgi:tRNA 2-selenouridine synthase